MSFPYTHCFYEKKHIFLAINWDRIQPHLQSKFKNIIFLRPLAFRPLGLEAFSFWCIISIFLQSKSFLCSKISNKSNKTTKTCPEWLWVLSKSYVIIAFPSYAFPAFEETLNRYLNALFIWYYIEDENLFSEDDFLLPRAKIIGFDNSFALLGFCMYSSLSVKNWTFAISSF